MLNEWVFLYGPPGSGKTSNGRLLAEALGLPFLDLDEEIEKTSGKSIPELFASQGEAGFRNIERGILESLLATQPGVIALGGGALLDEDSRALVEARGPVVCLTASLLVLLERLRAATPKRPLLVGDLEKRLADLVENRSGHYDSFPLKIANDDIPLEQSVWQVQVRLGRFHVRGMGAGYDVLVSPDALDGLGTALQKRGLRSPVAVVSDEHVAPLYASRVLDSLRAAGMKARLVTIPAGEQHKTIVTVQHLWDSFIQAGMERTGTVVALGGGVICDLAGFAAATFLRGVAWVAVPTSLLAMVDASLGGKTGADLPQGKNLVGAFHPPRLVLSDPQVLVTLPEREVRSGMAEVVKAGIIADPGLFETCAQGWESVKSRWMDILPRTIVVKVRLIQIDPYEQGLRAALNLGHTIGHALERVSNYEISHGEAVSIGMVAEARLAERINLAHVGLVDKIETVLARLGLPVEVPPGMPWDALISAMQVDKKRQADCLRFTLPASIGDVRTGMTIKPKDLNSLLKIGRV
jgi:shikimate kinase / 3-dehydroquinate synthase